MKKILILIGFFGFIQVNAQTVEQVDSLKKHVLENLDKFESFEYANKEISNEDAIRYDTACFYHNGNGELVYINWRTRSHTFHITGDGISISELFFLNGEVVLHKKFFYQFLNPQWHREQDLGKTDVRVIETLREYYKVEGNALMEYKARESKGIYQDRFTLLDSIPLEQKLQRRWSDRCDDCIEEQYLRIYKKLKKQGSDQ
ncbi:MAG: hypothetical protein ACQETL_18955 [Bacteroidota bacterium]